MLKWPLASDHQVQGWVRNLTHRFLSLESAIALTARETMFRVVVLRSHQPQGNIRSPRVNDNLIPGLLGLKLLVALRALVTAVLCVIMLEVVISENPLNKVGEREPDSLRAHCKIRGHTPNIRGDVLPCSAMQVPISKRASSGGLTTNLIHRLLGPEFAIAFRALYHTVLFIMVLWDGICTRSRNQQNG